MINCEWFVSSQSLSASYVTHRNLDPLSNCPSLYLLLGQNLTTNQACVLILFCHQLHTVSLLTKLIVYASSVANQIAEFVVECL